MKGTIKKWDIWIKDEQRHGKPHKKRIK
jgi:hypothetical protein